MRIAFLRGGTLDLPAPLRTEGDLWVRSLTDGRETRLTNTPGLVEGTPVWSKDGARIAYTVVASRRHDDAPAYSGVKIRYRSELRRLARSAELRDVLQLPPVTEASSRFRR